MDTSGRAVCCTQTLLLKIHATKSCAGEFSRGRVRLLMQGYSSTDNSPQLNRDGVRARENIFSKGIIFISTAFTIIWYMRAHKVVSQTYDREQDTFRYVFLIGPSLTLALMINHEFTLTE
eukprot:6369787-Pyramimonas_sp.AAC.1